MKRKHVSPRDHESMSHAEILSDLLDEFRARVSSGASITVEDFIREHIEFGNELRKLLPVADALADLSGDEASGSTPARREFQCPNGTLGDFRLLHEIGRGGMGIVYEAEQVSLGRRVALKVFPFATLLDSRQLERFKTEARTAAMLQHRHIVKVLSVGCDRGVHYYAMELIDGHSLANVVDELAETRSTNHSDLRDRADDEPGSADRVSGMDDTQPVAALSTQYTHARTDYFRRIARLGVQVAEALQYAHAQGVLHRDVKPSNLLLDHEGNVHVTDFGLARIGEGGGITGTGDLVGTMRYMAPEQLEPNRAVDFRADIYALGATLYELLAGKPLFQGEDRAQLLSQILDTDPKSLRQIDRLIPVDLETIVQKCVARFPTDRYTTAADVAEDLQRYCDHRPINATPARTMQTIRRWMRRNRRLSAAITVAACALLTLAIVGPVVALRQAKLLGEQRSLNAQLENQKESLRLARQFSEQQLYDSLVRNALSDADNGSFRRAAEVVQNYGETDKTSFEFSLLRNRLDIDRNRTVAKHWCDITKITIHPNNKMLAYGTWDGTVVVVDATSRSELYRHKLTDGGVNWIEALEFSPDGRFLLCGGADTLELRRVSDWELIPFPKPNPGEPTIRVVRSAEFASIEGELGKKTLFAVGDRSGYNADNGPAHLMVYEIDEPDGVPAIRHVATLATIRGAVNDVAFLPHENVLLACGRDLLIRRWQLPAFEELEPIDVRATEDSGDGLVSIVDIQPHPKHPDVVFFSTTKRQVNCSTSRIGVVSVLQGTSRQIAVRAVGTTCLTISPTGDTLAVGFDDGELLAFDTATVTNENASLFSIQPIVAHASAIHDAVFDEHGRQLFSASADSTLKTWSVNETRQGTITKQDVIPEMVFTSATKWLPDGRRIVSAQATDQPMLRLWDRSTGKRLQTCPVPKRLYVTDLCVVSDRQIAFNAYEWPSSQSAAMVGCWDLAENDVRTICTASGKTSHVAVSSDRRYLIAGIADEIVFVDVPTKVVDYRYRISEYSPVTTHPRRNLCAFVNDAPAQSGLRKTVKRKERNVVIWDVDARCVVATLPCGITITSLAFSPDGKKLAAGSARGTILLWTDWEAASNSQLKCEPQKLVGHDMHVWDVEFSMDNRRIASAALDGTVRLWNALTGNELMQIRTEAEWNYAVSFNPDGKSLAYAGGKGSPFGAIHIVDVNGTSR